MLENLFSVNFLSGGLLLAQRNTLGRLPAPSATSTVPLLIGVGLVVLVVMALVVAFVQYRQRRNARGTLHSSSELWTELCRLHQLDKSESIALRELAEVRSMEPAASVFVRADLWQLEQDSPQIRHLRPQLQRLQGILFAGTEPQAKVVRI